MLRGRFIKPEVSEVLTAGNYYYLFPAGGQSYYVSNFPNKGAHTGCYQVAYFDDVSEVIEEAHKEEDKTSGTPLKEGKYYTADLIYCKPFYTTPLTRYYLQAGKTHAFFWKDPNLKVFRGCFPLEWFDHFKRFEPIITEEEAASISEPEEELIDEELEAVFESEQLSLFDF